MKKTVIKVTALGLSAVLALGGIGGAFHARAAGSAGGSAVRTLSAPVGEPAAAGSSAGPAAYRDETVYVLAGADGGAEKVIVSDWLKNPDGLARLEDEAVLSGVENVKGSGTFSPDGAGRVWEANGGDIYSQGTSDRELPVEVSVSYTLDGRPIAPAELAGKSGRVTIRFDYTNRQFETVTIDGKDEQICVPFAVLTAVVLDEDRFANVEADNGRICSDGDRLAVVGMALPGLRESLDAEDLEIPAYLEIAADVTDFRLETTFTVATSEPFAGLDTDKLEDVSGLPDSLDKLEDAMEQLLDGSGRLYDGLGELLEKSGELASGIDQLASGAESLRSGTDALAAGAAQVREGSAALRTGLDQLAGQNDALNSGAEQVFRSLLASAGQQLAAAGVQVPELTAENYGQVLDGVIASLGDSPAAGQIAGLKESLDSYNAFYQGLAQYTAGVAQAAAGAGELVQGTDSLWQGTGTLSDGAARLDEGLKSLRQSIPALVDGVTELYDGAGELSDGLEEFDREGIRKLVDAFDGDLEQLVRRLEALADAADGYRSFSGGNETDGRVKFIYRTAAIETEE